MLSLSFSILAIRYSLPSTAFYLCPYVIILDMAVLSLYVVMLGLVVGSFLNALIDRLQTGETMVNSRSHCDHCGHVLEFWDLIPLFSWLFLGGRCRYCRKPISLQNPLVEITTTSLFLFSFYWVQQNFSGYEFFFLTLFLWIVLACLIVILVFDLKHQIIPDRTIVALIIVGVLFHGYFFITTGSLLWGLSFLNIGLSALFSALPYLLIIIATNGNGMGGGDMKLALVMGFLLGYPRVLVAHYSAFILGGIIAIILLALKRKQFGQTVAFGPFLVIGTIIALFWGEAFIKTYFLLFM